ncbi:protein PsiE [Novimethylophilus kurashikiensis]|uniref:Protein PsiE n=1 Tax=Novimethylophilus kurashikiensis TaxID=1825523 RepID=A0A2R5FGZ6_9PROT|nr:phosphate-starvation-inducible PsiE family protein [Novimethylophilus kurashikiensis]GBG15404.1 protein PsiE [Novimethylophilus kurashikiensis]
MRKQVTDFSQSVMENCEYLGLLVIAIATIIAAGSDVWRMVLRSSVTLGDLLMMFLYLEVLSMVRHYLSTGTMPVRYPLYIGIVALTRYLVLDMKELASMQVLALAAATLLLALSVLVVRFGHVKFPYGGVDEGGVHAKRD